MSLHGRGRRKGRGKEVMKRKRGKVMKGTRMKVLKKGGNEGRRIRGYEGWRKGCDEWKGNQVSKRTKT